MIITQNCSVVNKASFLFLKISVNAGEGFPYLPWWGAPIVSLFAVSVIFWFISAAITIVFIKNRTERRVVVAGRPLFSRIPYSRWIAIFVNKIFPIILIFFIFCLFLLCSNCDLFSDWFYHLDSVRFYLILIRENFILDNGVYLWFFTKRTVVDNFTWFWFNFGNGAVFLTFRFDIMQLIMLWVVFVVTVFVIFFSLEYMTFDPRKQVFIAHILFFSVFMSIFVMSDDLITAFIGWEGVGLSSFFLINFWFTRIQANKSSFKAILVNKIGDLSFLVAIGISYYSWKTVSFSLLWDVGLIFLIPTYVTIFGHSFLSTDLIASCLIIAAAAKSAQIGLHTWLPDAMEGPTPVSALIHAATMVTAGILLLIKIFPLLVISPTLSNVVVLIGCSTSLFAGTVACTQHDIKKIIAYSTCSQLGLMFMACGLGYPYFAFFHLITHAFFKALLFLSAGSVVHFVSDEQDIRKMGGLAALMPYTNVSFFFGNLCIIGFPFYSGFYSKEILLFTSNQFSLFVFLICLLSTVLTVLYSCRLQWYVMWRPAPHITMIDQSSTFFDDLKKFFSLKMHHKFLFLEHGFRVRFVLITLTFLSVSSGYFFHDFFVLLTFLDLSSPMINFASLYFESELTVFIKLLPVCIVLLVSLLFFWYQYKCAMLSASYALSTNFLFRGRQSKYYNNKQIFIPFMIKLKYQCLTPWPQLNYFLRIIYDACANAWHFNTFINFLVSRLIFFSIYVYYYFDRLILDKLIGAHFLFSLSSFSRFYLFFVSKANITTYFFYIFLFLLFIGIVSTF